MGFSRKVQCWLLAVCGAILIVATLPLAIALLNSGAPNHDTTAIRTACLLCGPGGFLIANILFAIFVNPTGSLRDQMIAGMWFGAFSFGAYGAILIFLSGILVAYQFSVDSVMKFLLLFGVTGASSGAWIAWQAWRSVHPEEKFWPRFSLGTLLIVVIAWGALLAVFAPK